MNYNINNDVVLDKIIKMSSLSLSDLKLSFPTYKILDVSNFSPTIFIKTVTSNTRSDVILVVFRMENNTELYGFLEYN